jgi:hypothetical protein
MEFLSAVKSVSIAWRPVHAPLTSRSLGDHLALPILEQPSQIVNANKRSHRRRSIVTRSTVSPDYAGYRTDEVVGCGTTAIQLGTTCIAPASIVPTDSRTSLSR